MGKIFRSNWSRGWLPSADAQHCPKDGLLRMDNCILDEQGVVAKRLGYSGIGTYGSDIHSLFTVNLNGTKTRFCGTAADVYANGASLGLTLTGTGDTSFGSMAGQVFMTRGTSHYKYDGTTLRPWGVEQADAPTVIANPADYKVFGNLAGAGCTAQTPDDPAWEDDGASSTSDSTGHDGESDSCQEVVPDSTTGRGVITKTWTSNQDFTTYEGGDTATDDDLIEFWAYLAEPQLIETLTLTIDVNGGDFDQDYYWYTWRNGDPEEVKTTWEEWISDEWDADPVLREQMQQRLVVRERTDVVYRSDRYAPNQWIRFQIPRGKMERVGNSTGFNWTTVRAVKFSFIGNAGGSGAAVRFDDLQILGGSTKPLTGKYKYRAQYVRNSGGYVAHGEPSEPSEAVELKAQSTTVAITAPSNNSDTHVNEIWLFRYGGVLDRWYRVATTTTVSGTIEIDDELSDRDAMRLNITTELDNKLPPDSIIGIAGQHYDRLYCLTSTTLYPSRKLDPDSYAAGQTIAVCGADETAYWVVKALNALYVGTSKDIYRIDGTGAENPDGTVDFIKTPLNIGNPPISETTAQEGNYLVYLAADGWRAFTGVDSNPLRGDTDLLWKGYTRHGISPVNLSTGRHRAAICKGVLTAITPECASTTSSTVLWRYVFATSKWYRHVYDSIVGGWRSVLREPDGMLIAGVGGSLVQLDTGTTDGGANMNVTIWTGKDDDDKPYCYKDPWDMNVSADTATANLAVMVYFYGPISNTVTKSVSTNPYQVSLSDQVKFRSIQLKMTGAFSTFVLYDFAITYRERPTLQYYLDTKPQTPSPRRRRFGGLTIDLDTISANATVTPVLDGTDGTAFTINQSHPLVETKTFTADVARDLWAKVACSTGFEYYGINPIVLEEMPQQFKGRVANTDMGSPALKVISGVKVKACTLGATRTFTLICDNVVISPTFTLLTGADEPATEIFNLSVAQTCTDVAFSVDGDIELYEWSPVVLYTIPAPRKVWDTGDIDTGFPHDLTWLREIRLKVWANADLSVTPYFDGTAFTTRTATNVTSATTVYTVQQGRNVKGYVPRVLVTSTSEFYPFWIELVHRTSGNQREKKSILVRAI